MPSKKPTEIRIVYLIGQLGLGGSEKQLYLVLKHMDRKRFRCQVIVFNPSPNETYERPLVKLGVKVIQIPNDRKGIARRSLFLHRKFRNLKPHIVHSWTVHDNPYAGILGRLSGVPLRMGSLRGSFSSSGMKRLPIHYRILSLFSVSLLVLNSEKLKREVVRIGYPESRIRIIQSCVDTAPADPDISERHEIRSEFGLSEEHDIVGTVGNLRRVKNQEMFAEGVANLIESNPDARGLIVGHTIASEIDYRRVLQRKIETLGMKGRIILTGFRNDVPRLLKSFNVFCLTSDSEGMPNVVLEAMAAECPVVATKVGQLGSVIRNGENGYLVAPGDVDGFSEAVNRLLSDPELAKRIGMAGRKTIEERFGCERMAAQMTDVYLNALGKRIGQD